MGGTNDGPDDGGASASPPVVYPSPQSNCVLQILTSAASRRACSSGRPALLDQEPSSAPRAVGVTRSIPRALFRGSLSAIRTKIPVVMGQATSVPHSAPARCESRLRDQPAFGTFLITPLRRGSVLPFSAPKRACIFAEYRRLRFLLPLEFFPRFSRAHEFCRII